jgi:hypothetical protein
MWIWLSIMAWDILKLYLYLTLISILVDPNGTKFSKTALWQRCSRLGDILCARAFKFVKHGFLQSSLLQRQPAPHYKLLSPCCPSLSLDSILWLLMPYSERSSCIRWCFGWLSGGQPKLRPGYPNYSFTKSMLFNVLICIKGYKCRLLSKIPYIFFWTYCPLTNHAPFNLFPFGFSAGPS